MSDGRLYLWELAVALGIFGSGIAGLRLLGFKRPLPLALSGTFGVSLWIALGGVLNLLHLWRPGVFYAMAGVGTLLTVGFALEGFRLRAVEDERPKFGVAAKAVLAVAVLGIGTMMAGGVKQTEWNIDDLQGYIGLGVKAMQNHSIQPDPFCERRVQAGVGGANFLDSLMFAAGDLRAMPFIDSTLGLMLYALGLWTLARRWRVPALGTAFALVCLPFATLFKVNLTIIYLSAAGFFAVLILLTDCTERFRAGRVVALGMIVGALCTTKSPNIVFVVAYLGIFVLLYKFARGAGGVVLPVALSLLLALAVFVPYSIANKANAGTYQYPLLGHGIHVSAYHLVPDPSKVGIPAQLVVVIAPSVLLLALSLLVVWKLSSLWGAAERAAVLAYLAASLLAVPVVAYGLGGEGADRYTAPFLMPALLLCLLIVCGTTGASVGVRVWRGVGVATLLASGAYTVCFLGLHLLWYRDIKMLAYEAIGKPPPQSNHYFSYRDRAAFQRSLDDGARIQSVIPVGATAIEDGEQNYIFDFHRNRIYIQDDTGLASPAPGLPLSGSAEDVRRFLVAQGVHYVIYALYLDCHTSQWDDLLAHRRPQLGWAYFLQNETAAHNYAPWSGVEAATSCHAREQMSEIMRHSPHLYDDGLMAVARID
jgi:hypothetical protein